MEMDDGRERGGYPVLLVIEPESRQSGKLLKDPPNSVFPF
jgi:hypothetical protein